MNDKTLVDYLVNPSDPNLRVCRKCGWTIHAILTDCPHCLEPQYLHPNDSFARIRDALRDEWRQKNEEVIEACWSEYRESLKNAEKINAIAARTALPEIDAKDAWI